MKKSALLISLLAVVSLVGCKQKEEKPIDNDPPSVEPKPDDENPKPDEEEKSLKIKNKVDSLYTGQELKFEVELVGVKGSLDYESTDPKIASCDSNGNLYARSKGKVTITVSLHKDKSIKDSFELEVKETLLKLPSTNDWDLTGLYVDENHSLEATKVTTGRAYFNVKGINYAIKANVNIKESGDWVWNGVGLGHTDSNDKFFGFIYSESVDSELKVRKKGLRTTDVNGAQQWGVDTDRAQIWDQGYVTQVNKENLELLTVRKNNEYYYFMDNHLVWKEVNVFKDYDNVELTPTLYVNQAKVKFTNISITTKDDEIETLLNGGKGKETNFYSTDTANATISEDEKTIEFKNVDVAPVNTKDTAIKPIGDGRIIPANTQGTIEYDLTVDAWGSLDTAPSVNVDIKRYDSDTAETRSFMVTRTGLSFAGWNYNSNMPAGHPAGLQEYTGGVRMKEDNEVTYHVVCTRLMLNNGQDCKLQVYEGDTLFAEKAWDWQDGYKGNVTIGFSVRNVACKLTNITYK